MEYTPCEDEVWDERLTFYLSKSKFVSETQRLLTDNKIQTDRETDSMKVPTP